MVYIFNEQAGWYGTAPTFYSTYAMDNSGTNSITNAVFSPGSSHQLWGMSAFCGAGTYFSAGQCLACAFGTFSYSGATSCFVAQTSCPTSPTTTKTVIQVLYAGGYASSNGYNCLSSPNPVSGVFFGNLNGINFNYAICNSTDPAQAWTFNNGFFTNAYGYCINIHGSWQFTIGSGIVGQYPCGSTNTNEQFMLTPAGNIVSLYGNELWDSFEATWGVGLNTFTSFNSGMPDKQWALSCNCAAGSALATPAQYAQLATYTITNGCVLCPAGYYTASSGATSCTICPVGFYSSASSTSCNGCPSYTFSSAGAATCTPYVSSCPLGGSIVIYNVNLQKCLYHPSASVGSNGFSAFNSASVFSYAPSKFACIDARHVVTTRPRIILGASNTVVHRLSRRNFFAEHFFARTCFVHHRVVSITHLVRAGAFVSLAVVVEQARLEARERACTVSLRALCASKTHPSPT